MNRIKFLGIGAGDITMLLQIIPTSSIYVELDSLKFVIDPGPGTLINMKINKVNPLELNGLVVSHLHPDHCADANAILSGITKKPSFLIAEETCLIPKDASYPCISKYHQELVDNVYPVNGGESIKIGNLNFYVFSSKHYLPTVGFRMMGSKTIGYPSCGSYYNGQENDYEKCDVIVFNTFVPYNKKTPSDLHTGVDDVIKLINNLKHKPKLIILQHFSLEMLRANPNTQAEIVQKETGVKTIAASYGFEVNLDEL